MHNKQLQHTLRCTSSSWDLLSARPGGGCVQQWSTQICIEGCDWLKDGTTGDLQSMKRLLDEMLSAAAALRALGQLQPAVCHPHGLVIMLPCTLHSAACQVYVNGTLVGGSDDLAAKVKDGSLKQLLSSYSSEASLPQQLQNAWQAAAAANTQASAGNMIAEQLPRELQLLLAALSEPQTGVPRKRRIAHSAPTFTGQDLIKWLVSHGSSNDRGEAAVVAQQLLGANAVTLVCDKQPAVADVVVYDDAVHSYALRGEAVGAVPWGQALNTHYWWGPRAARPAEVVAEDLRSRILQLYDKHLSNDGRAVSYEALRADPEFWEYVDVTAELQRVSGSQCDAGDSWKGIRCRPVVEHCASCATCLCSTQCHSSIFRWGDLHLICWQSYCTS